MTQALKPFNFKIMGVINVTPDSFSDGNSYMDPTHASDQALKLIDEGADFIDLGAESSRPDALPVDVETEWDRLEPVLKVFKRKNLLPKVTVDTRKPQIMLRLMEWGIAGINDIAGGAPKEALTKISSYPGINYIAMHMHGVPENMQKNPLDGIDAVESVGNFFKLTHKNLLDCGFDPLQIFLDPGIGFGKTDRANMLLIKNLGQWTKTYQVALGVSRKSFIGRILGLNNPIDRDLPSKMVEMGLVLSGASIIRTHSAKALSTIRNILNPG